MADVETLKAQYQHALQQAHDAPMNPYRENHDGHRWVEIVSTAWADRANEALRLRGALIAQKEGA